MSLSEVERFSRDAKSDADLVGHASASPLEAVVEAAAQRGYSFTIEEARTFIRARAQTASRELSDSELDGVTGGYAPYRESILLFL